ncbi:hypothetical protein Micbo1qcDRAFT_206791 [Microdochium bolleyi]|uniref:Steroid 5-alpha reductase C-terminal domain-containing protein n=1 Tax=Microdochium bolleyi TaxID=196109 RepID=A0A136IWG1_9PEZI|nr:hypothetical protein Micbo1qcDRAFT_206791 [Microdochium bolleyi]
MACGDRAIEYDGVPTGPSKTHFDFIERGVKKPSPVGTCTFVLLRGLDIPLQYAILSPGVGLGAVLLGKVGVPTITAEAAATPELSGGLGTGAAGILLALSAGSMFRQVLWLTYLCAEHFGVRAAVSVSFYNSTVNSAKALLFLALATTSLRSWPAVLVPGGIRLPLSMVVGVLCFVAGATIETVAEWQRKTFKARPEHRGRVCNTGLWRRARHINYLGYNLWRGGYCMAGSGWLGGLAMMCFQGYDLSRRAVAGLDEYCSARYRGQWAQFKREVPWKIVPGLYCRGARRCVWWLL